MVKISTLFKKDQTNLAFVTNEVDPENEWALTEGVATRKYDGTAATVMGGNLYKRYDVKKGKQVPGGAIPCQEPDNITGHWPHWVLCDRNKPEDKYFFQAWDNPKYPRPDEGTLELCGPKVQGNPEGLEDHVLLRHGYEALVGFDRTYEGIKEFLTIAPIEGIVFHHPDGRMCKIRKSDFGIKRAK